MLQPVNDRRLVVYRYWVRDGELLGCAVHLYLLLGMLVQTVVGVLALIFLLAHQLDLAVPPLVFEIILGNIAPFCWSRYTGVYKVDAAGRPRAFVSHALLPGMTLSNSMGRKRFLKSVERIAEISRS
ncbi:hypothetical protein [Thermogemmatispora tikiterensis]|uniref:Uncharacterized protein n=1 Tax=Thermogemmatispora tikiterensis TaxID=1825093 RepID=A0A328VLG7_9CHLR|nr:hypothetical protein [Thermogemmatispora tikiterensis]RAQ98019.1 hypothetical protein A4R35_20940 [Thermogemmatispora tikiterensis]